MSRMTCTKAPRPPVKKRSGAFMVIVAAGSIALLTFAAFAVDVAFLHLTRTRLEKMANAAARAGYEKLRTLQFNYAANQAVVDGVIHDYLEANGATPIEAAAATIEVERGGTVRVSLGRDSPTFFWRIQGKVIAAVGGAGSRISNNLGPYAIPTSYHDPDQDGRPNWVEADESIKVSPDVPWEFTVGNPYIIKFGRDSGQPGENADWVFIPMDDDAHTITVGTDPFTIPAQTVGNTSNGLKHTSRSISYSKAVRAGLSRTQIGLLRAYGIAYDCAGVAATASTQSDTYWMVGYAGGSFLIRKETLIAAGYTVGPETPNADNSYRATIYEGATSTGVRCIPLNSNSTGGSYRDLDLKFIKKMLNLANPNVGKIGMLKIPKQPKIATFTENNDPVTLSMINAGIPFTAFFTDGDTTTFHDFSIDPGPSGSENAATIYNRLTQPGPDGGPYDWLHLHHEDFAQTDSRYGGTRYAMLDFVDAIQQFVRVHHGFIFAACWATETLEIALARLSSPNWTADKGVPEAHLVDFGLLPTETTRKIQYDKTFAFHDFFILEEKPFADATDEYRGGNIARYATDGGCQGKCFKEDSEINTEVSDPRIMFGDYLNPLTQNHVGFGGFDYIESSDTVGTTYDSNDYVQARGGATDSFRHIGSPELHCANLPIPDPAVPSLVGGSYSTVGEDEDGNRYYDHDGGDRIWIRESSILYDPDQSDDDDDEDGSVPCDLNGNGIIDYVRIKDLSQHACPCGPSNTGRVYGAMDVDEWDGDSSVRGYRYRIYDLNCNGDDDDYFSNARYDENDDTQGFYNCSPAHSHEVLRPHVGATGGKTIAEEIDPNKNVIILAQERQSPPNAENPSRALRYISGIADDDNDRTNGFGRWSYMGGHSPGHSVALGKYSASGIHSSSSHTQIGIEGMRTYLNNILFGAFKDFQPGGVFTPATGAINPGGLGLGTGAGEFGAADPTANNFQSTFQVGSDGIGLPVGAQFNTAPGNYSGGTQAGLNFKFEDGLGNRTSLTWNQYQSMSATDKATCTQLATIAIVERIPVAATTPTPEDMLDDYMPGGTPAANAARNLSIYGGDNTQDQDSPNQARAVHVVGFAEYFLIDSANQGPDTQDGSVAASFVTTKWREGEVRGHFLRYIIPPDSGLIYPATPATDPR